MKYQGIANRLKIIFNCQLWLFYKLPRKIVKEFINSMSAKHGKEFEKGQNVDKLNNDLTFFSIAQSAVGIFRVNFHNEEI